MIDRKRSLEDLLEIGLAAALVIVVLLGILCAVTPAIADLIHHKNIYEVSAP